MDGAGCAKRLTILFCEYSAYISNEQIVIFTPDCPEALEIIVGFQLRRVVDCGIKYRAIILLVALGKGFAILGRQADFDETNHAVEGGISSTGVTGIVLLNFCLGDIHRGENEAMYRLGRSVVCIFQRVI
jgi:hypothetical protein